MRLFNKLVILCRVYGAARLLVAVLVLVLHTVTCAETTKVRVGVFYTPGYQMRDEQGNLYGYEREYLEEIAQFADFQYEFVEGTWSECLMRLQKGEIDLLGFMLKTPEREANFDFPYLDSGYSYNTLVTLKSNKKLAPDSPEDYMGLKIASTYGAEMKRIFDEYTSRTAITYTPVIRYYQADLEEGLRNGEYDAVLQPDMVLAPDFRVLLRFTPRPFYFATTKGNTKVLDGLNYALGRLRLTRPAFEQSLREKYYKSSESNDIIFSDMERMVLEGNQTLRIVYDPNLVPYDSFDEKLQKITGVSGRILDIVSEKSGMQFQYIKAKDYDDCVRMLTSGEADVLSGHIGQDVTFPNGGYSCAYVNSPMVLVKRLDTNLEKIPDPVMAITEKNKPIVDQYPARFPFQRKVYMKVPIDCLNAVNNGTAQLTILNFYIAMHYINNEYPNLMIAGTVGVDVTYRFVFASGVRPEIPEIFTRCIQSVSQEESQKIMMTANTESLRRDMLDRRRVTILSVSAFLLAALGFFSLWIFKRDRRLTADKQALQKQIALEERLKHELAFRRVNSSLYDIVLEADLTKNRYVGDNAFLWLRRGQYPEDLSYDETTRLVIQKRVHPDFQQSCLDFFHSETLLDLFSHGETQHSLDIMESEDGINYIWMRILVCSYRNEDDGSVRIVIYLRNINREKLKEIALTDLARRDSMTKLLNKSNTEVHISDFLNSPQGVKGNHALIVTDIDNFKFINDVFGHKFGDKIIRDFASTIRRAFPEPHIAGRIGGDEFVILVKNFGSLDDLKNRLNSVLQSIRCRYEMDQQQTCMMSATIGVAIYPTHGSTYATLYDAADKALYKAKNLGKDTFCVYQSGLEADTSVFMDRQDVEKLMNTAVDGICKYAYSGDILLLNYNSNYLEMLGFTREEMDYRSGDEITQVHPDDMEMIKKTIEESLEERKNTERLYRLRKKDGSYLQVRGRMMYTTELYQDRYPVFYVLYTDVSNIEEAQKELDTSQQDEEIVWLLTAKGDGIIKIAVDVQHPIFYYNDRFMEMTGLDAEQIGLGANNVIDYIHPDDIPVIINAEAEVLKTGGDFLLCYRFNYKGRFYKYMRYRGGLSHSLYKGTYPVIYGVVSELTNGISEIVKKHRFLYKVADTTKCPVFLYVHLTDTLEFRQTGTDPQEIAEQVFMNQFSNFEQEHSSEPSAKSYGTIYRAITTPDNQEDFFVEFFEDDQLRTFRVVKDIIRDDDGTPLMTVGTLIPLPENSEHYI